MDQRGVLRRSGQGGPQPLAALLQLHLKELIADRRHGSLLNLPVYEVPAGRAIRRLLSNSLSASIRFTSTAARFRHGALEKGSAGLRAKAGEAVFKAVAPAANAAGLEIAGASRLRQRAERDAGKLGGAAGVPGVVLVIDGELLVGLQAFP